MKNVTNSFSLFMTETPETGKAYMDMVMKQSKQVHWTERHMSFLIFLCLLQSE